MFAPVRKSPTRARGLKLEATPGAQRAPLAHAGAWIETSVVVQIPRVGSASRGRVD